MRHGIRYLEVKLNKNSIENGISSDSFQHVQSTKEIFTVDSEISSATSQDLLDEPGKNELIGQVEVVQTDMKKILDEFPQMEIRFRQERENDRVNMRNEMKSMLEECLPNSFRLNTEENVTKVIRDTGHSVIDDMLNERKLNIMATGRNCLSG